MPPLVRTRGPWAGEPCPRRTVNPPRPQPSCSPLRGRVPCSPALRVWTPRRWQICAKGLLRGDGAGRPAARCRQSPLPGAVPHSVRRKFLSNSSYSAPLSGVTWSLSFHMASQRPLAARNITCILCWLVFHLPLSHASAGAGTARRAWCLVSGCVALEHPASDTHHTPTSSAERAAGCECEDTCCSGGRSGLPAQRRPPEHTAQDTEELSPRMAGLDCRNPGAPTSPGEKSWGKK